MEMMLFEAAQSQPGKVEPAPKPTPVLSREISELFIVS